MIVSSLNYESLTFFRETEFIYSFWCTVNVNSNIQIGGKIGENMSRANAKKDCYSSVERFLSTFSGNTYVAALPSMIQQKEIHCIFSRFI